MKTAVAAIAGLGFGMLFSSIAVNTGCSCPPGREMIAVQPGTYVADDPSVEPDYRLEIAHSQVPAIERYTRDGKQLEVIYQNPPRFDGGD
jgi:hypothetical protein